MVLHAVGTCDPEHETEISLGCQFITAKRCRVSCGLFIEFIFLKTHKEFAYFLVFVMASFWYYLMHMCMVCTDIATVMWTVRVECISYLQIANEFKWNRAVQMVLILGNSFDIEPHDRNILMSFLRRKPRLQCLSSRTISYIVSKMFELLSFFVYGLYCTLWF